MKEEKKNLYVYIVIGYLAILLLTIAAMKFKFLNDDNTGFLIIVFGYLLMISFIRFMERKIGVSQKGRIISRAIFMALLAGSFLLFY